MPPADPSFLKLCHLADESALSIELDCHGTPDGVVWTLIVRNKDGSPRVSARGTADAVDNILGQLSDALLDEI